MLTVQTPTLTFVVLGCGLTSTDSSTGNAITPIGAGGGGAELRSGGAPREVPEGFGSREVEMDDGKQADLDRLGVELESVARVIVFLRAELEALMNPMTSGSACGGCTSVAPTFALNMGGKFYTLLCALLNGPTQGGPSQNFELCFVPYGQDQTQPYDGRLGGQFFNEEGVRSTPEQTGPCNNPSVCAVTPTVRLMSTSSDPYDVGTWEATGRTQTSSVQQATYQISVSTSELQTALNNANYWLEVNNGGARCTVTGYVAQGYAQKDGQCDFPYAGAATESLIALEQDGEGQGVRDFGFSQTGLTATTP